MLQAEFQGAWVELDRFLINSTVGVAGFGDPARNRCKLEKGNEDFKEAAIDPYFALRDAYDQYRKHLVTQGEGSFPRPAGPLAAD